MRLLIVKLSSIGDVVHTLPAAAILRRSLPDSEITWVVERRASAILKDSPAIDTLIEIDSRAWRNSLLQSTTRASAKSALNSLNVKPDYAIDFQGLIKSGAITWLSKARKRIGFETSELRESASRLFLNQQVSTRDLKHVIEKNLELAKQVILQATGSQPQDSQFEFPIAISDSDVDLVQPIIRETGNRFAIINPGGGWSTKRWREQDYSSLADYLLREHSLPSLITFGPGEESMAASIAAKSKNNAAKPIASTVKQFVALAKAATIFIGGDTGPLHLAAAVGTPIVGIYGPTAPQRNGPFDRQDITVGRDLWCRPECHRRSCWHWMCMNIEVETVADAVRRRLKDIESKQVGVR